MTFILYNRKMFCFSNYIINIFLFYFISFISYDIIHLYTKKCLRINGGNSMENKNFTTEILIDEKECILKYLGMELSKIRKNKKISVEKIADKTFLSESYIRAIEKGLYSCSIINFLKICLALNVNPTMLLNKYTNFKNEDMQDLIFNGDKNIGKNIVEYLKK